MASLTILIAWYRPHSGPGPTGEVGENGHFWPFFANFPIFGQFSYFRAGAKIHFAAIFSPFRASGLKWGLYQAIRNLLWQAHRIAASCWILCPLHVEVRRSPNTCPPHTHEDAGSYRAFAPHSPAQAADQPRSILLHSMVRKGVPVTIHPAQSLLIASLHTIKSKDPSKIASCIRVGRAALVSTARVPRANSQMQSAGIQHTLRHRGYYRNGCSRVVSCN